MVEKKKSTFEDWKLHVSRPYATVAHLLCNWLQRERSRWTWILRIFASTLDTGRHTVFGFHDKIQNTKFTIQFKCFTMTIHSLLQKIQFIFAMLWYWKFFQNLIDIEETSSKDAVARSPSLGPYLFFGPCFLVDLNLQSQHTKGRFWGASKPMFLDLTVSNVLIIHLVFL